MRRRWIAGRLVVATVIVSATIAGGSAATAREVNAAQADGPTSDFVLTVTDTSSHARVLADFQGFSVETADFAHGFLTKELMAERLKTLGPRGVIRLGGYSMDLVWPAFGPYRDDPVPPEAIGGVVDQSDLDKLDELLDATGWKVTLGAPLKGVIDPSKIKNPSRDPSPRLTLEQVVAEVKAAYETLGDDLLGVELGNEYDNVTTLTEAELWETMKQYREAIHEAVPKARLRMIGPSANTSRTNTRLNGFVTAVLADTSTDHAEVLGELASHWYPGSHCGSSNLTIEALMSPATVTNTRAKLAGIMAEDARVSGSIKSTINESNSASCSGQPDVSNAYATSLWSLDYLLQAAQSGVSRLQFHTNTAAICGDFKPRESPDYPISYRYYGAFCAADQAELDANGLSPTPLYYGIWAFRQVPAGSRFLSVDLADADLDKLRAYALKGSKGTMTVVLINVQDPASATSTTDRVTLRLPSPYRAGRQVVLRSAAPEGLASTDVWAITLGGHRVLPSGVATGRPKATPVDVAGKTVTVTVPPGTASIVSLRT
ncbi:MAG TPA: glycosyl hydrolase family 79 C-terminal domain-containing protein [Actinopolymorphaceae bacterium]